MRGIVSRIWRMVTVWLPRLFAVFAVVIGVLGIVAYSKNGWFPYPDDLIDVLKGVETKNMLHENDAWGYMLDDPFSYVWMGYLFLSYLISVIMSYKSSMYPYPRPTIIRGIISTFAFVTLIGGMIYLYLSDPHMGMWSDTKNAVVMAMFILMVVLTILAFRGTMGGVYMKLTLIVSLGYFLVVPLAMWFWTLDTAGKIGTLAGVVVYIILWFAGGDLIQGIGESSSSPATSKNDKNKEKARGMIDQIDREIKASKRGIEGHRRGETGYGHVNERSTQNTINSKMKERDFWKKQLAK